MRSLVALAAVVGIGCSWLAQADEGFGPASSPPAAQAFKVGALHLIALSDGKFIAPNDGSVFGVDAGKPAVSEFLKAKGLPQDRISLSVNVLLVRTAKHAILLDTGLGPKANASLIASLKEAGISPAEITDIAITHTHGDHVGGLVDASGQLAFPKATIRMAAAEWAWMKSQPGSAELVKTIETHVKTFTPGDSIAPGVKSVVLAGHTPGHVGYEIVSGHHRLLDIGDLAHSSVLSLQKPEWTMGFDSDSVQAKSTRRSTLARLAKDQEWIFSTHFPYPGLGHIAADGDAFAWQPGTP